MLSGSNITQSINSHAFKMKLLASILVGTSIGLMPHTSHASPPASHLKSVDELFKSNYKIYSPLTGFLSSGSLTDKTFSKLDTILFTKIPGAEVFPTHMGKNPGAHLSGTAIAQLFVEFEKQKAIGTGSDFQARFQAQAVTILISDEGYKESLKEATRTIEKAQDEFNDYKKRAAAWEIESKKFNDETIEPVVKVFRKLKAELKKKGLKTSPELVEIDTKILALRAQAAEMKKQFLADGEKTKAEKKLKRAKDDNDFSGPAYQTRLAELTQTIAESFANDELSGKNSTYTTTATLLSYLWIKSAEKADLQGYLSIMSGANFLNKDASASLNDDFYKDYYSRSDYTSFTKKFAKAWRKRLWISKNLSAALAVSAGPAGGHARVPEIIAFSWVRWVKYSLFADCVEIGLHNIFNLFAYDPKTNSLDYRILQTLKDRHFPKMDQRVIEFFKKYPTMEDHKTTQAASEWIGIVSHLNNGYEDKSEDQKIDYKWPNQTELMGPYTNLLKVLNRLMGYDDVTSYNVPEIFARVKEISGFDVSSPTEEQFRANPRTGTYAAGSDSFVVNSSCGKLHLTFEFISKNSGKEARKVAEIIASKASHLKADHAKEFRYRASHDYLERAQNAQSGPSVCPIAPTEEAAPIVAEAPATNVEN
jgi:hypothetical protein